MIKRFLTICAVALVSMSVANGSDDYVFDAGSPRLSAAFEPDSVGIGDRFTLMIDVEQDVMQVIAFPEFDLGGDGELELVGLPQLDTLEVDGRRVKLRRKYTFTSFQEGVYNLGRVSILCADKGGADTIYSDQELMLMVGTYLIDSTSHSIFDLKPVRSMPFKFGEISGYVMWGVFALILLVVAAYFVLRLMAHYGRPVMGLFTPAPPLPPHVAALKALEDLRGERLWQDGEYKGYYSKLTDILRTYISGRYGVMAMEMTSDEIIVAVRDLDLPRQCEMELRDLLRDADLVKFAKAELEASQNERYFDSARLFVDMTKVEEEVEEEIAANPTASTEEGESEKLQN
ncbi:MAG: hypothetical protein SNF68_02520 [Rikenellaceae bacterium]